MKQQQQKSMKTCPACDGSGNCPVCDGRGEIQKQDSFFGTGRKPCPKCSNMPGNCTRCKGNGVVPDDACR